MAPDAAVSKEGLFIPASDPTPPPPPQVRTSRLTTSQLIDFSKFLNGSPEERKETADAILSGFQNAGFIYLKNHPIPLDFVRHTFSRSADFFAQPDDAKLNVSWTTPQANRGYSAPGREKVSQLMETSGIEKERSAAPDLKESYEIGREGEPEHPNQWPKEEEGSKVDGFKTDMLRFFDMCKGMHVEVMRAIAVGMGLGEAFFDKFVDVGDNTLRLLHYPAVDTNIFKVNANAVRAGAHSVGFGQLRLVENPCVCVADSLAGLWLHHAALPGQPGRTPGQEPDWPVRRRHAHGHARARQEVRARAC